tara:strand:+ start:647 stop:1813 length:1167 start_codon:yes stop_codon:yes gene_type:complete
MKKNIIVLGSTGSIGVNTLEVIRKDKKKFNVILLSTNKNIKKIFNQAKEFRVKNIIVNDYKKYCELKKKLSNKKIKVYNKFDDIHKVLFKKKIFYSMIAISGLDGLEPSLISIKYSKNIGIVNKESLICGWNLIRKEIQKYNTNFFPIDSEHYSIFTLLKNHKVNDIDRVFITASGGPFLNFPKKKFNKIKPKNALNHPNWKMGKKITIDSATLMNKVFEVIEAKKIFNIPYKKISILTHPDSYVHAIVKFKNGITKILLHEPNMKIPISNSIYNDYIKKIKSKPINFKILNNLNFKKVDNLKFSTVKILKNLPNNCSLYETIIITVNDFYVYKFLNNKINFSYLIKIILKTLQRKEFIKYKKIIPKNINQIYNLRNYVRLKLDDLSV